MVGEIRPEFPEREVPVDDFDFGTAVPLFVAAGSLMTREELTGFVEDVELLVADLLVDGCSAGDSPFERP